MLSYDEGVFRKGGECIGKFERNALRNSSTNVNFGLTTVVAPTAAPSYTPHRACFLLAKRSPMMAAQDRDGTVANSGNISGSPLLKPI